MPTQAFGFPGTTNAPSDPVVVHWPSLPEHAAHRIRAEPLGHVAVVWQPSPSQREAPTMTSHWAPWTPVQACDVPPLHAAPPCCGAGLLQARVRVPLPHGTLHGPHALHPPFTGQACALQPREPEPWQSWPPKAGAGLLQERLWVPPPQGSVHAPQLLHPPFTGQAWLLQARDAPPLHCAPPFCGGGLSQPRVCVPPPQAWLHAPQLPQPPSTGHGPSLQSCRSAPAQAAPPCEGAGLVHVRSWKPAPQVALHAPQPDQPPFTGHSRSLQASTPAPGALPTQSAPPCAGAGFEHVLLRLPSPHVVLQPLHSVHSPSTGHGPSLHACKSEPPQSAPPCSGAGLVHVRLCVPSPQVAVQLPHALQPPATGQKSRSLQARVASPVQSAPPWAGAGWLQERLWVPSPHVTLQAPHAPQPPSTGPNSVVEQTPS